MDNHNLENKVISGLIWKFLERFSAQFVTFFVSIILARILSPEDYGSISIVNIFICLVNVFVVSGFGTALIQKKDADDVDFSTVFYFNLLFSLVLYVFLFFLAPFISEFYKMPLTSVTRVLSISVIISAINSIQHAYVSKKMLFFRFFWSTLVGTVISAVIGIVMAVLGYGVWSLVAQHLTNQIIDTIVLWITVRWRPTSNIDRKRLKPLIKFGWKLLLDSLFINIYDNLKSLVIGKVFTTKDLAFYSKGISFPNLLVTNINSSISSVLFPAFSEIQNDIEKLKKGVRKSIRMSSFFLTPALIGLFVIAPTFISLLLTDKWINSVPYLRIACVYYLFFPMTTADAEALLALGKSDIGLKLTFIKRFVGITLIGITIKFGIMAVVISDLFVVLLAVSLNLRYMKRFLNYRVLDQIKDILPSFICSFGMGLIVTLISKVTSYISLLPALIIQIFTGILSYTVLSFFINKNDTFYIKNKLIRKNISSKKDNDLNL